MSNLNPLHRMINNWVKKNSRTLARNAPRKGGLFLFVTALAIAGILGACATRKSPDDGPAPGSGIAEYKEITTQATTSIRATLDALEKVSAQPNPCPTNVSGAFTERVLQLHSDSLRVRARAQAILSRGDAYFASWSENMGRIKDPQIRSAAEHHRPELEQSFEKIKVASKAAGAAFKPFTSGLRLLRVQLEKESGLPQTDATKQLVSAARSNGEEVLRQLNLVMQELDQMRRILGSEKS